MPSLQNAIETFLKVDRSPYTTKNYSYNLNKMASAIGSKRDITLISVDDLLDYVAQLDHLKPTSKKSYVVIIKTFFKWCVQARYIQYSPADQVTVRLPKEEPDDNAMPPDVLAAMIDASKYHPRNYALLLFIKSSGCRRGGAASLRIPNLFLDRHIAKILKKGGSPYWVQFDQSTTDALAKWLDVRPQLNHDYVFISLGSKNHHQPLQPEAIADVVRALSLKVCGKEYGPHSIRHRTAHAYAERGVPITVTADKLGHINTRNTERYYPRGTHEVLSRLTEEIDPAEQPNGKIIKLFNRASND